MKRRTNPSLWTVRQVSELYCNIRKASSPDWFFGIGKYGPFQNTHTYNLVKIVYLVMFLVWHSSQISLLSGAMAESIE